MSPYIIALRTAYIAFPFVALALTFPYVLYQYHKYGSLMAYRIVVVYTFWFYVLCMCFLVSLPLPTFEEVSCMTDNMVRLVPFQFLTDIRHEADIAVAGWDLQTLSAVVHTQTFFEVAANIVMMIPFGIYLHYYFRQSWPKVMVLGFCMSLFFEVSQITALFGIYPRPYRYFDVDDLICNTAGAVAGSWITPLCTFFLPKREKLDELSYERGRNVTFLRRLTGMIVDMGVTAVACVVLYYLIKNSTHIVEPGSDLYTRCVFLFKIYIVWVLAYFCVVPAVSGGMTAGRHIVGLRLVNGDGSRANPLRIMIRQMIVYYVVMPAPGYAFLSYVILSYYPSGWQRIACVWAICLFMLIMLLYICDIFVNTLARHNKLFYDRLSGTKYISFRTHE